MQTRARGTSRITVEAGPSPLWSCPTFEMPRIFVTVSWTVSFIRVPWRESPLRWCGRRQRRGDDGRPSRENCVSSERVTFGKSALSRKDFILFHLKIFNCIQSVHSGRGARVQREDTISRYARCLVASRFRHPLVFLDTTPQLPFFSVDLWPFRSPLFGISCPPSHVRRESERAGLFLRESSRIECAAWRTLLDFINSLPVAAHKHRPRARARSPT